MYRLSFESGKKNKSKYQPDNYFSSLFFSAMLINCWQTESFDLNDEYLHSMMYTEYALFKSLYQLMSISTLNCG